MALEESAGAVAAAAEEIAIGLADNEAVFMSFLPYIIDTDEKESWKNIKVGDSYEDILNTTQARIQDGDSWRELVAGFSDGSPLGEPITASIGEKTGLPQLNDEYMNNILEQWKGNEFLKGFEVVGIESHEGHDPYAIVFKNDDTLLIAYRGTENGKEWWDDAKMGLDPENSQALKDAVDTVDKYHEKYPECKIWTDGHSRGGTESMFAAMERPDIVDRCYSVEGMSMSQSYMEKNAANIEKASPKMVSLNAENDFCNQFGQNPCGTIKYFQCNDGPISKDNNFLAGHIPLNILGKDGVTLNPQVSGPTEPAQKFHDFAASVEKDRPAFYKYATEMFCAAIPIVQGDHNWQNMASNMFEATKEYGGKLINDFVQKTQGFIENTKTQLGDFINHFADKLQGMDIANSALGKILSPEFKENVFGPAFNELAKDIGLTMVFGETYPAVKALETMGGVIDNQAPFTSNFNLTDSLEKLDLTFGVGGLEPQGLNMRALECLSEKLNQGLNMDALDKLTKDGPGLNMGALDGLANKLDKTFGDTMEGVLNIGRER